MFNVKKNCQANFITNVTIQNLIDSKIYVKISENGVGGDAEFQINELMSDSWGRYSGELKMQIRESNDCKFRYKIDAPGFYKYMGQGLVFMGDDNSKKILPDENIHNSDFKTKINFTNNTDQAIFVRISTIKDFGSEDLFQIERFSSDSWRRFCGEYILEIVDLKENSFKYNVCCEGDYIYEGNGRLIDNYNSESLLIPNPNLKIDYPSRCDIRLKCIYFKSFNKTKYYNKQYYHFYDQLNSDNNSTYLKCDYLDFIPNEFISSSDYSIPSNRNLTQKIENRNLEENESNHKNNKSIDTGVSMKTYNENYSNEKELTENELHQFYNYNIPILTLNSFKDFIFPPEIRIINSLNEDGGKAPFHFYESNQKPLIATENIVFKRPIDIYKNNNFDLLSEINPNIPLQGKLGDCYLISVLSSLAKKPEIIKKIFKTKNINPYGYYEIYFYEGIEKRIMFLDDYIPIDETNETDETEIDNNKPYFCRGNKNQLWCILMEKALAKYENGYSNIHCGNSKCSFQFFTGANTRWITTLDSNYTWEDIFYAANNNHVMVAGSKGENHSKKDKYGIHNEHTYSILDAKEYFIKSHLPSDRHIKLIKLRNPWGYSNVETEFSLNSKIWNEEMKVYFGYNDILEDKGIFFIAYEIFIECFNDLTICYI